MAQYIYTMNRVSKMVPPKREILKDISLSFFPGAKIGVLGLNGSGKSTLLRIMAGLDKDFQGEARAQTGIKIGFLEQEPQLDPNKTVRENVEDGLVEVKTALARLDEVFGEYALEDADFDKLAAEQEKLEGIIQAWDAHNLDNQLEQAADALRLPAWDADVTKLSGGERQRAWISAALAQEAQILILDEPTSFLDIGYQVEVLDLVYRLSRERGVAIVMAIHDLNQAMSVSDRISLLDRGRLVFD